MSDLSNVSFPVMDIFIEDFRKIVVEFLFDLSARFNPTAIYFFEFLNSQIVPVLNYRIMKEPSIFFPILQPFDLGFLLPIDSFMSFPCLQLPP